MNKKEAGWLVQSSALAGTLDWACSRGLDPLAGLCLCPFSLGLFSFYHIFGPTKWTSMTQLPWVFIPHGLLLLKDIKCSLGFDRYL